MNGLVYHIVSGQVLFTGVALLILAAAASTSSRPLQRVAGLAFLLGIIGVAISSTALPHWCYGLAVLATLVWIASRYIRPWRRWATYAFGAAWLVVAACELPYHVTPSLRLASHRTLTVIGDSVTAGVGGDERSETWPSILARVHHVQVQDLSHMGETAASAFKRAQAESIEGSIVLIEIGGNDILGTTSSAQFAQDLDALLSHVSAPERQVLMFELPLPPFYHEFGRIQRSAAATHGILLVPKRVFLSVIAGSDSTLDTIHLSQQGHDRMAAAIWQLVGEAFPPPVVE